MLALTVKIAEIKEFMSKLLRSETFDEFDVKSVIIESFARVEVSAAASGERLRWTEIKPYIYDLIKRGQKPILFKVVLALAQDEIEEKFIEAKALFINIIFENGGVKITTGMAEKMFSLQRTTERAWDEYVRKLLDEKGVVFDEA